jgi:hypothetical protein
MKETRKYMKTICKSLADWEDWSKNGERCIKEGKSFFFDILARKKELNALDAELVKDEMLDHGDSIGIKLERLDKDYKLLSACALFEKIEQKESTLPDKVLNIMIDDLRLLIRDKLGEIVKVFNECEERIKPKNPIITKALADPLLLTYFYDSKKDLEEYINFCLSDANKTMKAYRAKELVNLGKIKDSCKLKPLHDALIKIGIDVGSYPNWQQSINRF